MGRGLERYERQKEIKEKGVSTSGTLRRFELKRHDRTKGSPPRAPITVGQGDQSLGMHVCTVQYAVAQHKDPAAFPAGAGCLFYPLTHWAAHDTLQPRLGRSYTQSTSGSVWSQASPERSHEFLGLARRRRFLLPCSDLVPGRSRGLELTWVGGDEPG
jgi:hypothetical protein